MTTFGRGCLAAGIYLMWLGLVKPISLDSWHLLLPGLLLGLWVVANGEG